jgi:alginate O-acetyltransferase complex protein AlgJ
VLDLLPVFLKHRHDDEGLVYCQTDTHWSGRGVALAAEAIAEHVRDREWLKRLPRSERATESRRVEITGDLARLAATADGKSPVREMLTLTFVGSRRDEQFAAVAPDRDSPVLLMGDSHVLVFHDPRQLAQGAGLPDQLALRLGLAVDLIGVQGSGSAATRIDLARRKDNLRGKKLVIWCFSVRELAKGAARWPKVSVIRQ